MKGLTRNARPTITLFAAWSLALLCLCAEGGCELPRVIERDTMATELAGEESKNSADYRLIELASLKVAGPSFGGPYVGLSHNKTTSAIMANAEHYTPILIERLRTCGYAEACYIVFIFRDLKEKRPAPTIAKLSEDLESGKRFNEPRDLTLSVQIQYYFRDIEWQPEPGDGRPIAR